MKALVSKSQVKGKVAAPGSKSYTIRGLMCSALAKGESEVISPLGSDDTEASLGVLSRIGVSIRQGRDLWRVSGGNLRAPDGDLYCRESAATLRFMTAISSIVPGRCRLTAAPSLAARPIKPLVQALQQVGVDCVYSGKEVVVNGGKLRGGVAELPGNISSQFVSALLFIAPFAEDGLSIRLTTPLESRPFVLMTVECLRLFGINVEYDKDLSQFTVPRQVYQPAGYLVEGDWSSASYLLALGAFCGEVEVENLNPESQQGDKIILDFLKKMGAIITCGKNSIIVRKSALTGITADLTDCIDLLPTMAVLAAVADGVSEFTGIERARLKESDRVATVRVGLEAMGIKTVEEKSKLTIIGSKPKGAAIDTCGDHRIAMAFSLLGLIAGDTTIDDAGCVSKTYPEFWNVLESLGAEVNLDGK